MNIAKGEISFTLRNIMLNNVHAKPKHLANYIVLIVKQYIFYCKCSQTTPVILNVIKQIETMYQIEKYNSHTQSMKYFARWEIYDPKNCK